MAQLVGDLGVALRAGELERVVEALSNLGFDDVESIAHPSVGELISCSELKAELEECGAGKRSKGLAVNVHSKLARRFGWSVAGDVVAVATAVSGAAAEAEAGAGAAAEAGAGAAGKS